jgi:hypothetical protein
MTISPLARGCCVRGRGDGVALMLSRSIKIRSMRRHRQLYK